VGKAADWASNLTDPYKRPYFAHCTVQAEQAGCERSIREARCRAALRQRSLRPVDNSSRPPVFERLRRPAASRPTTRWSAVIVVIVFSRVVWQQRLSLFSLLCANSACWSRLSAYHTAVVASSPIAIDMLPSLSWLDHAQRLVVVMYCPMWDFLRTFFPLTLNAVGSWAVAYFNHSDSAE